MQDDDATLTYERDLEATGPGPRTMAVQPGDVIDGRFRLDARAGQGACATVYRAHDRLLGRDVALKLFDRECTDVARFEREAELLASVQHEHVVAYVAHGLGDGSAPYLAMEWLEGWDLHRRMADAPLTVHEALVLTARAARGLAAAHALGIVHRDVKPSNLLLVGGRAEDVRVIDFGIARRQDGYHRRSAIGSVMGTPAYMAPEQALGDVELSARVDVFALGSVLFECLTGTPPILEASVSAQIARLLAGPMPRLAERWPEAPSALDDLVARMIEHDPSDRLADASAVALAVSIVLESRSARYLSRSDSPRVT